MTRTIGNHLFALMWVALIFFSGTGDALAATSVLVAGLKGDGKSDVSIVGNEFTSDLPTAHGVVSIQSGTEQVIVKDNVMRFTGGKGAIAEPRQVVPSGKDEALAVQKDEALQIAQPARMSAGVPCRANASKSRQPLAAATTLMHHACLARSDSLSLRPARA